MGFISAFKGLMSVALTALLKYFIFQYHYISLSVSLLFLSRYTPVASMLILYYTIPLSTTQSKFSHSYASSALYSIVLPDFYTQTHYPVPVFYSPFYALSSSSLSAKFILSKSIDCKIGYTHYFLAKSTVNMIFMDPCIVI